MTAMNTATAIERQYSLRVPLVWRELDGDWVVMADDSGSLHHLDALSAALLGLLEAGPADLAQLLAALSEAREEPAQHAWSALLTQALQRLIAQDLVQAAKGAAA